MCDSDTDHEAICASCSGPRPFIRASPVTFAAAPIPIRPLDSCSIRPTRSCAVIPYCRVRASREAIASSVCAAFSIRPHIDWNALDGGVDADRDLGPVRFQALREDCVRAPTFSVSSPTIRRPVTAPVGSAVMTRLILFSLAIGHLRIFNSRFIAPRSSHSSMERSFWARGNPPAGAGRRGTRYG